MRATGIITTALACLAVATSAVAQEQSSGGGMLSGHDLYELTTGAKNEDIAAWNDLIFTYYVAGVLEAAGLFRSVETRQSPKPVIPICQPTGSNSQQAADIVKKYLLDHPEQRHIAAVVLVTFALQDAFPCPATEAPK